jgi:hypothetical protein
MTPAAILELARRLGVEILVADGRVGLRGPSEARARLRPLVERHKAELLAALTRPAAPALSAEDRRRLWWGQPASAEELERMAARVERGERLGLSQQEADTLADRLHLRDRDLDGRRLCAECRHIRADGDGWRCAALRGPIPRDWVVRQLQRCPSFDGGAP